jgi:hypothetical protein
MDKVEYTERERWLIEPKPGTAAARARDLGLDLSLTVSNLRLTPEERLRKLDRLSAEKRESGVTSLPAGYDRHLASLLELEAILEYPRMLEAGEI